MTTPDSTCPLAPQHSKPSSSSSNTVVSALTTFVEHWLTCAKEEAPEQLLIDYDADWPSLCYQAPAANDTANHVSTTQRLWQPVRQEEQDMFTRLSQALNIEIHPDIISFYSLFWSEHLSARTDDGELTLLQVWNQDDMERLRGNLLGHALAKQKSKQEMSFFFALTSPDDGMLTVNNKNGEVWFEYPGKKPIRKIADSLATFIQTLQPSFH